MIDDIVEAASRERDTGDHDELTVVNWWRRLATGRDKEIAVLEAGEGVSFGDLDRRSADLAWALLDAGYGKGSRIALLMGNSADWIAAWLATQRIGALETFSPSRNCATPSVTPMRNYCSSIPPISTMTIWRGWRRRSRTLRRTRVRGRS